MPVECSNSPDGNSLPAFQQEKKRTVRALQFSTSEMAVVVQNCAGWFLDACLFIDQGHSSCMRNSKDGTQSSFKCGFKRQYFRVNKSYCSAHASAVTDGGIADVLPSCDKPPKVIKK